jgi:thiol-disulfide isomerase/thioredoxin
MLNFLVMVILILSSCKDKKNTSQEEGIVSSEVEDSTMKETIFPVYDYEGLKPLLYRDDDKTYIINFWATWCKPCIEEMPFFEKTYEEQKDNNVALIFVSLDMPSMWKSRLEPFVKKKGLKGKVVILDDPNMNDWIPQVDEDWGGGIPATLFYNKDKRAFFESGFTYEELNEELNKFLKP